MNENYKDPNEIVEAGSREEYINAVYKDSCVNDHEYFSNFDKDIECFSIKYKPFGCMKN